MGPFDRSDGREVTSDEPLEAAAHVLRGLAGAKSKHLIPLILMAFRNSTRSPAGSAGFSFPLIIRIPKPEN